jgi:hypothetical protein
MARTADRIALVPDGFRFAQELFKLGADNKAIEYDGDRSKLQELIRKGVARSVGGGRGVARKIKLLVKPNDLIQSTRKPRGSGFRVAPEAKATKKPTWEAMHQLTTLLFTEEKKIRVAAVKTIEAEIEDLQKSLLATKDRSERKRILDELQTKEASLDNIEQEVRKRTERAVSQMDQPYTKWLALLSTAIDK